MRTALKVIIALELVCIVVVVAAVLFVIGDRGASSAEASWLIPIGGVGVGV